MPIVRLNDHDMYYEVLGAGEPVLCMGGWGTFAHDNHHHLARGEELELLGGDVLEHEALEPLIRRWSEQLGELRAVLSDQADARHCDSELAALAQRTDGLRDRCAAIAAKSDVLPAQLQELGEQLERAAIAQAQLGGLVAAHAAAMQLERDGERSAGALGRPGGLGGGQAGRTDREHKKSRSQKHAISAPWAGAASRNFGCRP